MNKSQYMVERKRRKEKGETRFSNNVQEEEIETKSAQLGFFLKTPTGGTCPNISKALSMKN